MPETTAIAALTPFIPSPLTIKMAMIASLFQMWDIAGVKCLSINLKKIEVTIMPPIADITFKAV